LQARITQRDHGLNSVSQPFMVRGPLSEALNARSPCSTNKKTNFS